jgi:hypothetical protein
MATRQMFIEDDAGSKQEVSMCLSYFMDRTQLEDFELRRSLLPRCSTI